MPRHVTTDNNGVVWSQRQDRNGKYIGQPIKVLDPNVVQARVPTPRGLDILIWGWSALTSAVLAYLVIVFMTQYA